jgi:hypothetical protein
MGEYPFIEWWVRSHNNHLNKTQQEQLIDRRVAQAKMDKAPRTALFPVESLEGAGKWRTIYDLHAESMAAQKLHDDWGDTVLQDWADQ